VVFIFLLLGLPIYATPDACQKPPYWCNADCDLTIIYRDPGGGSGLAECLYKVVSKGFTTVDWIPAGTCSGAGPVELTVTLSVGTGKNCRNTGGGTCVVYAKAKDAAGNETIESQPYNIDFVAPVSEITSPNSSSETGVWYPTGFVIDVNVTDYDPAP
jgi:hypothetical protein